MSEHHMPKNKNTGGLAGWLLQRLRTRSQPQPKLALLERITVAPRQTLSLIEADGRRLLVATSPEGAAAFYPLDYPPSAKKFSPAYPPRRASW